MTTEKEENLIKNIIENFNKDDRQANPMKAEDLIFLYELNRKGDYQEKDTKKALEYLQMACDMNNISALEIMAMNYFNGSEIVEKNETLALKYFELAALNGSTDSMVFLGLAHMLEIGTSYKPMSAIFWLKMASDRGNKMGDEAIEILLSKRKETEKTKETEKEE